MDKFEQDETFQGDDSTYMNLDQVGNGDSIEGIAADYSYTVRCGWIVLCSTWVIFVLGVGSMFGVWKWVWAPATIQRPIEALGDEESDFPIEEYYPSMLMLLCVIAWIWCVVSWVGMKLFRHAKGGVSSDLSSVSTELITEISTIGKS
ncbi:hypothetical protein V1512DRAFT_273466 [Lipomyces arxii]|uniref:uncharacterized protein n=1 Tax=Lipomyces arxii TaxID=56418 RepID=UPI0034CDC0F2